MVKSRVSGATGKWGGVVSNVEVTPTTQDSPSIEMIEIISPYANVLSTTQNNNIVDLYSVGHEEFTRAMCDAGIEVLFQHTLQLLGPQGETVRVSALFDV